MNEIKHRDTSIKHFVREHLGCDCPDEVFDNIKVSRQTGLFSEKHTVYEIGGRLFVTVFFPVNWHDINMKLGKLVVDGKQFRDQHGYNRFRLVIVTDDDDAENDLLLTFNDLPCIDDKTHLHVINPSILP